MYTRKNKTMNDVMIDIETLGISPLSIITQLGGVYFDRTDGTLGDEFLRNLDIIQSLKEGFQVQGETLEWWLNRPKEQVTFLEMYEGGFDIRQNLHDFNEFLRGAKNIWCHATFDFVHVTEALKKLDIKPSYDYTIARDIRTLQHLAHIPRVKSTQNKTHNALDDCKHQVEYCVPYLNKLTE